MPRHRAPQEVARFATWQRPSLWSGSVAALLGVVLSFGVAQAAVMRGQVSPDFTGTALDGRKITLSDFRGKNPVVFGFHAKFVAASQREFLHLKELDGQHGGKGLKVLSISLDEDRESAGALPNQHGTRFPVILDPKSLIGAKYNVQALPHTVVVDREGKVAAVVIGVDREAVNRAVEQVMP